jgi:hypothetical protein
VVSGYLGGQGIVKKKFFFFFRACLGHLLFWPVFGSWWGWSRGEWRCRVLRSFFG